jgi:transposase
MQRDVQRARIVLACADGGTAVEVGKQAGAHPRTVERWRARFLERGLAGLADDPRSGHRPKFGAVARLEIIALACAPVPTTRARPRYTIEDIRQIAIESNVVADISWTSVQRILADADLRPHLVEGWVHSPDPLFREKATEICELYLNPPTGSVVLSIDEKTGMQALERKYPDRPASPGRKRRREFEYKRHGTQSLLAALDVHTGRVLAECGDSRTGLDLERFMDTVAEAYPTGPVHVVWDNLNIHFDGAQQRWTRFNERHGNRFVLHYTPKHASWVNQIELFFSIMQRQCLRDASFRSKQALRTAALSFVSEWNARARPFKWTFTGYPLQIGRSEKAAA